MLRVGKHAKDLKDIQPLPFFFLFPCGLLSSSSSTETVRAVNGAENIGRQDESGMKAAGPFFQGLNHVLYFLTFNWVDNWQILISMEIDFSFGETACIFAKKKKQLGNFSWRPLGV